tara:strand:+ start:1716 stop:2873 length:1158 start_codon:yes stop_codon:yes gene_type:complete
MGAGTVGNRDADVLLSLGMSVSLCKYNASEEDIKSKEVKILLERYSNSKIGDIPVYAARGSDLEERVSNIKKHIGRCDGSIDDANFKDFSLAIDCTNGMEIRNYLEVYDPNDLSFAINGGGDNKLIERLYFASIPHTEVHKNEDIYKKHNAKIVSCNTHAVTTALSIVKNATEGKLRTKLRDKIYIDFARRHEDPNKGKERPHFVTTQRKKYHTDEVYSLLPDVNCLLDTTVSKWPTEYFHNTTMILDFKDKLSGSLIDKVKLGFQKYPRAILSEGDLSHEKTITAAEWARIKDGDIPFPVYMVNRGGDYKLVINGLTPQRGIVSPSTADYALLRTGTIKGLDNLGDIFDHVNKNARYRNETFSHIKDSIQDNLAKYDEYSATKN